MKKIIRSFISVMIVVMIVIPVTTSAEIYTKNNTLVQDGMFAMSVETFLMDFEKNLASVTDELFAQGYILQDSIIIVILTKDETVGILSFRKDDELIQSSESAKDGTFNEVGISVYENTNYGWVDAMLYLNVSTAMTVDPSLKLLDAVGMITDITQSENQKFVKNGIEYWLYKAKEDVTYLKVSVAQEQ